MVADGFEPLTMIAKTSIMAFNVFLIFLVLLTIND